MLFSVFLGRTKSILGIFFQNIQSPTQIGSGNGIKKGISFQFFLYIICEDCGFVNFKYFELPIFMPSEKEILGSLEFKELNSIFEVTILISHVQQCSFFYIFIQ